MQAAEVVAKDRESSQRDLYEAIERGDFPKWNVKVQIMPELEAETYHINPFDLTKVWPHADYPLIDVDVLELNRNPENYFAEIEQAQPLNRQPLFLESVSRPTKCCKPASCPMQTPTATASVSTMLLCRSTNP